MSTFSRSPFGTDAPAPPPAAPAVEEDSPRRPRTLLLGGAGAAALLLVAGAVVTLTDSTPVEDAAPALSAPATVPESPAPEPSIPPAQPREAFAARNPFLPLVSDPVAAGAGDAGSAAGVGASGPATAAGAGSTTGTATTPATTPATGTGARASASTGAASTGAASTGAASTGAATPSGLDAAATCTAADGIWEDYAATMLDESLTETMAGHEIGDYVAAIDELATNTTAPALRQPLHAWSLETGEVRALLVTRKAWRPGMVGTERNPTVSGRATDGALPALDETPVITARTAQRERCYQLTDPLVTQEEM